MNGRVTGRVNKTIEMIDHGTNQEIKTDKVLLVRHRRQGRLLEVVIERQMNVLTIEEICAHKNVND